VSFKADLNLVRKRETQTARLTLQSQQISYFAFDSAIATIEMKITDHPQNVRNITAV
jgi:hypothetical protein